jgi:hypothetical protein
MIKTKHRAHNRKWFVSRIGKRIYRYGGSCRCEHCKKTLREGLVVAYVGREGRMHADYLCDCQNEMGLRYSDRPFRRKRI